MAQVPEDVKAGIQQLAKKKEIDVKILLKQLKEIMETEDTIKEIENDSFKIRASWAVLYRKYSKTGGVDCYFTPLMHCEARGVKTKDGNSFITEVTALVKPLKQEGDEFVENGDWEYASGAIWGDTAKNLEKLEVGKTYQTKIILGNKDGQKKIPFGKIIIVGKGNTAEFKPVDVKTPDFKSFYEENIETEFPEMQLGDIDVNQSKHVNDLRISEVTIMEANIEERDNREYGYYDVMDESITGETKRFFIDPRDTVYLQGSIVKVGTTVDDISKENEEPKFIQRLHFIIPEIAETTTYTVEEDDSDRVDIGDDEPEEEDTTDSKKEKNTEDKDEDDDLFEI